MGKHEGTGLYILFVLLYLGKISDCLGAGNASVGCLEGERLALLKFRRTVTDYFGLLTSWDGQDCCRWKGVTCDNATGSVVGLDLKGTGPSFLDDEYQLTGDLDSALVELKHLKYLDLSGNYFQSSRIPDFIGSLEELRYFNVSNAWFGGEVPPYLGNLSNLQVLDLSCRGDCFLELKSDDLEWVTRLSSLQHLDISGVDLRNTRNFDKVLTDVPSLTKLSVSNCYLSTFHLPPRLNSSRPLSRIQYLDLSQNSLANSTISFLRNMTSLVFLDLSGYDLSQPWSFQNLLNTIPSLSELRLSNCRLQNTNLHHTPLNLTALSDIQNLDLSQNSLGGEFPSFLANMTSLRSLDLSSNGLNSSVPSMKNLVQLRLASNSFHHIEDIQIWSRCKLKVLSLSNNDFQEEIISPSANLSECPQYDLEKLYLTRNQFRGQIPSFLGRLNLLRELYVYSNRLTGPIPASLGQLTALEELDLQSNQLTGSIPASLGNLTALQVLSLESNQLTGPVPEFLGKLGSLQVLSLASNQLNGTLPLSLGQLTKLRFLDISNNSLEGLVFGSHFANLSRLKYLAATSNHMLTFNISPEWMPPFQLRNIRLSSCKIGPEFPRWIRSQGKLVVLLLSNASISGPLPLWLRDMSIIPSLDLSYNLISGPLTALPSNFSNGLGDYYLGSLILRNNLLEGQIPVSFCKRSWLQYLDISNNKLSGELPECLGNVKMLRVLLLSSNRQSGAIPSSLGNLSSLRWLSLSNNSFHGELPTSMGNEIQVLDVGDNEFTGSIPKWIGENIESLAVLRLHNNNFSGRIPLELCNGSVLQIMDLAHNFLVGTIPHCLGQLDWMVQGSQKSESFIDLDISYGIFEENLVQVMKGVALEYTKNMRFVTNMDLSSNELVGEVPEEMTNLSGLIGLNLSHNRLTGGIPDRIGNMKALISLDLSANELSEVIPPSIAALNFLSHLNLSYNNLSGQIPSGNQLQTLTDPSTYVGNEELCGAPLPKNCSNDRSGQTRTSGKEKDEDDESKLVWFYLPIISGFTTGFWGIIGVLLFKKRWRQALFRFVEVTVDKIYVATMMSVSKMKRERGAIQR